MQRSSIIAITFTLVLFPLPTGAQYTQPACQEGSDLLGKDNSAAIDALSVCIADRNISRASLGVAYYNRSVGHFFTWVGSGWEDVDHIERAYDDVEVAIELDRENADAYCLRGKMDLETTFGNWGYEDIDKGKALGGRPNLCVYE